MSAVFSSTRNDPTYRSALNEAGVYGITEFTAIYDGSRWVAEVGKLRDGRYALVTRLRHPKTGALQPFIGSRGDVRQAISALTDGDLCSDARFLCQYVTGSEYMPEENQHMPVMCDHPAVQGEDFCTAHLAPFGQLDCDGCGDMVNIVTNPRDLVIVLCAACNGGTPVR